MKWPTFLLGSYLSCLRWSQRKNPGIHCRLCTPQVTCSVPATIWWLFFKDPGLIMALIFILPFGPFIVTDDRNRRPLSHSWLLKRKRWSKTQPNYLSLESAQSVQSLSRVRLFVTPWTAERQASLSIINSRSLLRLMSIKSVMPSNHLILCVPFSSLWESSAQRKANRHSSQLGWCVHAQSLQSSLTLCDPVDYSPPGCPWDSPGKNTGVGCRAFLELMCTRPESVKGVRFPLVIMIFVTWVFS